MIILTVDEISQLHEKLIAATGGSPGMRDTGLLESAVMGCSQTFGGEDIYPTIIEKAARMAFAVCKNHPFIDGNLWKSFHKLPYRKRKFMESIRQNRAFSKAFLFALLSINSFIYSLLFSTGRSTHPS